MRHHISKMTTSGLLLLAYLLCLPLIAVWFVFWMIVGSIFQPPDRLANRYFRFAVGPLLLPVCLLPDGSPTKASVSRARGDRVLSDPTLAGVYA